jgi:hypothetical protein
MKGVFFRNIKQAVLIWLTTNVLAGLAYGIIGQVELIGIVLCVGMLFSAPVIPLLIPVFHLMRLASAIAMKMLIGTGIVLLLCCVVVASFCVIFEIDPFQQVEILLFLWPYPLSALISFFLIARKSIFQSNAKPSLA